jgi:hypothetical protein
LVSCLGRLVVVNLGSIFALCVVIGCARRDIFVASIHHHGQNPHTHTHHTIHPPFALRSGTVSLRPRRSLSLPVVSRLSPPLPCIFVRCVCLCILCCGCSRCCCSPRPSPSTQPQRVLRPSPTSLELTVSESLQSASKNMIEGMLAYYGIDTPGAIPGIFNSVQSYYWWMAGAAWNVASCLNGEVDCRP